MQKLALLLIIVIPVIAYSQIINIPDDYPSIQEGINAAENGDTVLVALGYYHENINFNGKNITVASHFLTTQDTSLIEQTRILGGNSGSVVTINSNEDSTALLCGFKITNGNSPDNGGGIYCKNANPCLEDLIICFNEANYGGGGIYIEGAASPVIKNVTIFANEARTGAGIDIWSISNPQLINVTIYDNFADYGAGIYHSCGEPILSNVTIKENSAEYKGGGIYSSYALGPQFNINDRSNIYNNSAGEGNDIYTDYSMAVILDTFTVIYPTDYYAAPLSQFSFDIAHGIISQTDADLYVAPNGSDNNDGLTPDDPLQTLDYAFSIITADSLHQNSIYLLEGNYAYLDYPIELPDYISLEGVNETTVILDAELYPWSGVFRIANNQFNNLKGLTINKGTASDGGGIYCRNSNLTLENLIIQNNTAYVWQDPEGAPYGGEGGGIFSAHSNVTISNVDLCGNNANSGGGICCWNSQLNINNVRIFGNQTYGYPYYGYILGGAGAGIDCSMSTAYIENSKIDSNESYSSGGGIYGSHNSALVIENTAIIGNESGLDMTFGYAGGAGISLNEAEAILRNVNISDNSVNGIGGGILNYRSDSYMYNVTMSDNIADSGNAIFCMDSSYAELVNCILWQQASDEIYFSQADQPNNLSVQYSDILGGEAGIVTNNNGTINWLEGNINEDPLFVGLNNHPYSLSAGSPCIDRGIPDTTGLNLPTTDILGNKRFWDGDNNGTTIIDMGAYEFGSVPVGIQIEDNNEGLSAIQCYPNPISETVTLLYSLPNKSFIEINIYNNNGQPVLSYTNDDRSEGTHRLKINVVDLKPGIYFCALQTNKGIQTTKMIKL